ncbi:hypothetical protein SAMN05216356_11655 [Oribacterium sp. WCC10]|nr:hypothetical protein SAMN05216356_11655 [Oribacterium sp. WCC10]
MTENSIMNSVTVKLDKNGRTVSFSANRLSHASTKLVLCEA